MIHIMVYAIVFGPPVIYSRVYTFREALGDILEGGGGGGYLEIPKSS